MLKSLRLRLLCTGGLAVLSLAFASALVFPSASMASQPSGNPGDEYVFGADSAVAPDPDNPQQIPALSGDHLV